MLKRQRIDRNLHIRAISESGEFSGYGSVFGVEDSYGDVVVRGAFERTLGEHRARGTLPAMLWQHNSDQPIGVYSKMEEDDHGLYLEGKLLVDRVQQAAEAHALLQAKAITGLSIGFRFYSSDSFLYDEQLGLYKLLELELMEVSPVTFPANDEARVENVKSAIAAGEQPRAYDIERILRETMGLSKRKAKHFVALGMSALRDADNDADNQEACAVLAELKRRMSA